MRTVDHVEKSIQAAEFMIIARKQMEEMGYVQDVYRKNSLKNPFYASYSTMQADQENIRRFEGYAGEAFQLIDEILKEDVCSENIILREILNLIGEEYRRETEAFEKRLLIYERRLRDEELSKRRSLLSRFESCKKGSGKKEFQKLRELIYSSAEVKNQILSYERKIQANEQVYQWYSKKLIKGRKEKQTIEQALKYITEHRENLEESKKIYKRFWLEMRIMQKE